MLKKSVQQKKPAAGNTDQHILASRPSSDTLHLILLLHNKLMAPFSTHLEHQYKISLNEFRMLMLIGHHPHSASHELAEMTGVNPMSVSRAVTALQKHGRIAVDRDPANKRRKTLSLTEEGQRLYRVMQPQSERVADYLISALSEKQVAQLNHYLEKMIASLAAKDEQGRSLFLEHTRPADSDM